MTSCLLTSRPGPGSETLDIDLPRPRGIADPGVAEIGGHRSWPSGCDVRCSGML